MSAGTWAFKNVQCSGGECVRGRLERERRMDQEREIQSRINEDTVEERKVKRTNKHIVVRENTE